MTTSMQDLIEWCNSCLTDKTMSDGGRIALEVTIVRANDLLEKEKNQSIGLIQQTAMFLEASKIDNEIAKMSFEDVYNSYYNQNK